MKVNGVYSAEIGLLVKFVWDIKISKPRKLSANIKLRCTKNPASARNIINVSKVFTFLSEKIAACHLVINFMLYI